jgi:signal transduction histidine kinase
MPGAGQPQRGGTLCLGRQSRKEPEEARTMQSSAVAETSAEEPDGAPAQPLLLLVDDQPGRLLAYEAMLGGLGVGCVKVGSGAKALERVLQQPFAVILLDVNMPEMDGFEVARLVRQHPRFGSTPIIFVTAAHATDFELLRGYQLGAIDYISMPVAPEVLRSKVAVLVEMHRKRSELEALNRQLDAARQQVVQGAEAELRAKVSELNALKSALEDADRRKDEFLAMLAHELRNPVAPIRTAAETLSLLLNGDVRKRALVDVIQRQSGTLARILDDLLDVARITQGHIELQPEVVAVAACVEAALQTTAPLMRDKAHRIEVTHAREPLHVRADRVRLEQCVTNLLTNAAKFTDARGEIHVRVCADGRDAVIDVCDNGVGIAPAFVPRVFDLFSQSERSIDRSQGGLGLGLAICRQLIELHGGRVSCASDGEGRGATFTLRLPLAHVAHAMPATLSSPAPAAALLEPADTAALSALSMQPAAPVAGAAPPKRVLVVDDNCDAADTLALWLEAHGHATRTVYGAEAALDAVDGFAPDVVLLDLGLPGMDGYEVARRIKRGHRAMRVVALSGYGQARDKALSAAAGFDAHAVKPVDMAELDQLLGR